MITWYCTVCGKKQNTIVDMPTRICKECQSEHTKREIESYNELMFRQSHYGE